MTPVRIFRRHAELIPWVRAAAFVGVTAALLAEIRVVPIPATAAIALAVGGVSLLSPSIAAAATVVAVSVPVLYANIVVGLPLLVVGLATVPWLGRRGALRFLLVASAVALIPIHAEWTVAIVAGYLLGAAEGAAIAAVGCVLIEGVGIVAGAPTLGAQATGGVVSLVKPLTAGTPAVVSVEGLLAATRHVDLGGVPAVLLQTRDLVLLVFQPTAWAVAAAVTGLVGARFARIEQRMTGALVASASGAGTVTLLMAVAAWFLHSPAALPTILITGGISVVVALVWLVIWEWLFKREVVETADRTPAGPAQAATVAPAIVLPADMLLRALRPYSGASLSEASDSTTVIVAEAVPPSVEGSPDPMGPVAAAFEPFGARGTSGTGALVAAFDDPSTALAAAVDGLRAAAAASRALGAPCPAIRIGVSTGGLFTDRYGRPADGPALVTAAAVRAMAQPWQLVATAATVAAVPGAPNTPLDISVALSDGAAMPLSEVRWTDDSWPLVAGAGAAESVEHGTSGTQPKPPPDTPADQTVAPPSTAPPATPGS